MVLKSTSNYSIVTPPPFIRHVLDAFRQHTLTATEAAEQLDFLPAASMRSSPITCAPVLKKGRTSGCPAASGGNHTAAVAPAGHRPPH